MLGAICSGSVPSSAESAGSEGYERLLPDALAAHQIRWLDHYTTSPWPYQTATKRVIPNSRGEASGRQDSNLRPLVPQCKHLRAALIEFRNNDNIGETVGKTRRGRAHGRAWTPLRTDCPGSAVGQLHRGRRPPTAG